MIIRFTQIALIFFILNSCSNNQKSEIKQVDDSSTSVISVDTPYSELKDNIKNYTTLPIDSMFIKYKASYKTIHGYRNNDNLIVEGDMKFEYPVNYFKSIFKSQQKSNDQSISEKYMQPVIYGVGTPFKTWPIKNGIINIPYFINSYYKNIFLIERAIKM